jgi:CPA2 family monovalent cation:H+ antiporter-2
MHHDTPLISTLVTGLVLAFIFGALAQRIRISPLVGYLLAGILIGPFTPGYVADQKIADQLAEIGVILLMFGVGLHFSLDDLLKVKAIAIPGAIAQIAVATLLGMGLAHLMGWSIAAGLVFGLPCRWPRPWCCCAPCRNAGLSRPSAAASRSAG